MKSSPTAMTYARRSMALGRASLVLFCSSALELLAGAALRFAAPRAPELVERVYSRFIYAKFVAPLSFLSGALPFSLAELLLYALCLAAAILAAVLVYLAAKRNWRAVLTALCAVLLMASSLLFSFYANWGLNYYRLPLSSVIGLNVRPRGADELEALCRDLAGRANELRGRLSEDGQGVVDLGEKRGILLSAPAAMENLTGAAALALPAASPKAVLNARGMSSLGISGVFIPFTLEANVNAGQPDLLLPATACHEAAHALGFAREEEANFLSFLACRAEGGGFEYSGTVLALIEAGNRLNEADPDAYSLLRETYCDGLLRDFQAHNDYWDEFETPVSDRMNEANDAYLKAHGQQSGVRSYGDMVDLLLAAREAGWFQSE